MRPLFQISEDLARINAVLDECEGDLSRLGEAEAEFTAFMDSVALEDGEKLDSLVNWTKQLEMEAVAARAEAEQYLAKSRAREGRAKRVKDAIKRRLEDLGQTRATTASGRIIAVQKNGGRAPLEIDEDHFTVDEIDPAFIKMVRQVDPEKVRAALEAGEPLAFAKLGEIGTHLRVR